MTSNWEKFKNQQKQQQPTGKPLNGRKIDGNYMCQTCYQFVTEGTYFPTESVLEYKCSEGHDNIVEKFYLA